MKRSGFSMIELVFVIVIMGILAAVAVPKMMGTSSKAKVAQCQTFYSTFNTTVSPTLWMRMVQDDENASVAYSKDNLKAAITIDGKCGSVEQIHKAAIGDENFTIKIDNVEYDVNATVEASSAHAAELQFTK